MSPSVVSSINGLFLNGKKHFGLSKLRGISLVAYPPTRNKALIQLKGYWRGFWVLSTILQKIGLLNKRVRNVRENTKLRECMA